MLCCYDTGHGIDIERYDLEGEFKELGRSRRKEKAEVKTMKKNSKMTLYTILSASVVAVTILSNLAAIKITSIFGWPTDCGFICYPVTFLLTDLLNRNFGLKRANFVTLVAGFCNLAVSLVMALVVVNMKPYIEWTNQVAFAEMFNFGLRITTASIIVYLISHLLDNYVFARLDENGGKFIKNSFLSSLAAQAIDSVMFITLAFGGTMSVIGFIKQVVFGTIIGLVVQIVYLTICAVVYKD